MLIFNAFRQRLTQTRVLPLNLRSLSVKSLNCGPIETIIKSKLHERFKPIHLEVSNESHMHNVPKGAETHFRVLIVSDEFKSVNSLNRHRSVNETLKEELKSSIHALAIQTFTSEQYNRDNCDDLKAKSPPCRGGMGM